MGCSVREAQSRIDSREFTEWMLYEQIEPFGERADWIRHGHLMSAICNALRRKGARAAKPEDFMPRPDRGTRRQTAQEIETALRAVTARQEAKAKR